MSADRWLYTPEICDGHECIADCDRCWYREEIFEAEEDNVDYISRQAAIDALASIIKFRAYDGSKKIAEYPARKAAKEFFANIPAADVVEVVRCNECIHNVGIRDNTEFYDKDIVCDYWESDGLYSTDFCSYGERTP